MAAVPEATVRPTGGGACPLWAPVRICRRVCRCWWPGAGARNLLVLVARVLPPAQRRAPPSGHQWPGPCPRRRCARRARRVVAGASGAVLQRPPPTYHCDSLEPPYDLLGGRQANFHAGVSLFATGLVGLSPQFFSPLEFLGFSLVVALSLPPFFSPWGFLTFGSRLSGIIALGSCRQRQKWERLRSPARIPSKNM